MTPFDMIGWALAALVSVAILSIPFMVIGALIIEARKRWRESGAK